MMSNMTQGSPGEPDRGNWCLTLGSELVSDETPECRVLWILPPPADRRVGSCSQDAPHNKIRARAWNPDAVFSPAIMARLIALVVVGCVLVAVGGILLSSRFRTNDYRHGSFTTWVKRTGPEARVNEAVALMGATAIPDLLELLNWTPNATERNSRKLHDTLPNSWRRHFRILEVSDPDLVHIQALGALGGLGPEALQALPAVLSWTTVGGPVGEEALIAALRIAPGSPEVTQKVVAMLLDRPARRDQAARAMVATQVPVEGALTALVQSLRDGPPPNPEILSAISLYGREASSAVSRLGPSLRDASTKSAAIDVLRAAGPTALPMLPEIRQELDPSSSVVVGALEVAGRCGIPASAYLPAIKDLERSRDGSIGMLASIARARIEGRPTNAIPAMVRELRLPVADATHPYSPMHPGLRDIRLSSRQAAAWLLGELGTSAKAASSDLNATLRSEDPRLMVLAAWSLWKINQEAEPSVGVIRRGLAFAQDPVAQRIAIEAVTELGSLANLAFEDLERIERQDLRLKGPARAALDHLQGLAPLRGP